MSREASRFWASGSSTAKEQSSGTACSNELRNRGCRDALFVCCDGLTGLPESITAVWPAEVIQTCVVHLLRSSMRYASFTDRRKMATALRPIYTAVTEEAAALALEVFRDQWRTK